MRNRFIAGSAVLGMTALVSPALSQTQEQTVQVDSGTVAFDSPTNVSAISVHGKSAALKAEVHMRRGAEGFYLEKVSASLPIKTISTGMGMRDEHMRKYIFTTQDGQLPDLRFSAENTACPAKGRDTVCDVAGRLAIRGVERPFHITLKIRPEGNSGYRAAGDGTVKLTDYGIERPSQLGVKSADEVKLHIEFTGKPVAETAANRGGQ